MKKPNLFIAGPPKCATTALYAYLADHPNTFFSAEKEPHYFADDLGALETRVGSLDEYLKLFDGASAQQTVLGEASVWYLYSSAALEKIRAFNPGAKIIVIPRNPVDLVRSLHADYCCGYIETEFDLEKAWDLSARRREGIGVPRACPSARLLDYPEIGKVGKQVVRLLNIFPARQVKVILFDDFVQRTGESYRETLEFLGLPDDGRAEFPVVNESRSNRLRRVTNALGIPPDRHKQIAAAVKGLFGADRFGLMRALRKMNFGKGTRPAPPGFRRKLQAFFAEDIALLGSTIGRDLSGWGREG